MSRPLMKVLRKALTVVAAVGALGVGLLMASLWLEHNSSLELPRPTGPFAVGRVSTTWVDTSCGGGEGRIKGHSVNSGGL